MREIDSSLRDNLLAERVVILADACHSANIGGGVGRTRDVLNNAAVVNRYLQEVSKTRGGVALLTSAESNEVAREDEKWGDGHGVFTYYLLEGMRGNADYQPKDGTVTVGELFEYVRENVKRATSNKQHPSIGPNEFDRNLPMAITGGITAQEHYQLGCNLYELGWILDDNRRFKSANRQLYEAIRLARLGGVRFPEAHLQLGRSLMALKQHEEAIEEFKKIIEHDSTLAEAYFYLGITHAKQKDHKKAVNAFEKFLKKSNGNENEQWVTKYIDLVRTKRQGTKYALLIGIDEYIDKLFSKLSGCVNDVQMIKEVLIQRYEFHQQNIVTLINDGATYQSIQSAFEQLNGKVTPNDYVVVHFSGHGFEGDFDKYLVTHNTVTDRDNWRKNVQNSVAAAELHSWINNIPTNHKTLILDTHPNLQFLELVKKAATYNTFLAALPGQIAYEHYGTPAAGAFTYFFTQQLGTAEPDETYGEVITKVVTEVNAMYSSQTPLFIGNSKQILFTVENDYLNFFDFALRKNYATLTKEEIRQEYIRLQNSITVPFPQVHGSFAQAFLEKRDHTYAIKALKTAMKQQGIKTTNAYLKLGLAQAYSQNYDDALINFENYLSVVNSPTISNLMEKPISIVSTLKRAEKHALLVGINDYISEDILDPCGAVNDAQALKAILMKKFGFEENNIKVLLNRKATREEIIKAFEDLVEKSHKEPALFYFAGNGSSTENDSPTILSVDARQYGVSDIELQGLSKLGLENYTNLVTIIDASWHGKSELGMRTVPTDRLSKPMSRSISSIGYLEQSNYRWTMPPYWFDYDLPRLYSIKS